MHCVYVKYSLSTKTSAYVCVANKLAGTNTHIQAAGRRRKNTKSIENE